MQKWPKLDCAWVIATALQPIKQASEPSPKLIIVATYTHGNNGGPGIAMLQLVADLGPSDGPTGCIVLDGSGKNWTVS